MKEINKKLTLKQCWTMVNRIDNADTPEEVRDRCETARLWLIANEVITNAEFDDLMMAVAQLHRESYHWA